MRMSGFAMTCSQSGRVGLNGVFRLQAVQEIRRALRMGRGAENGVLVLFQHLDPRRDIGGVIVPNLRRQVEVGGKKRGTELGDELLIA
jgi:hypothetical protein